MAKITIAGIVLALATLGLVVLSMLRAAEHSCEVCVTYHGRTMCRTASAASVDEAVRTATDNACAFLAGGMTETVQCAGTTPDRVTCDDRSREDP